MAETIDLRSEETIPDLEDMLDTLFDKEEVKTIIAKRKDFEYKMERTTKSKHDYLKYIYFDQRLLRMIRLRHKKKGHKKRLTSLENSFGIRLNKMYLVTIRRFSSDVRLWVSYIKFCKEMRFYSAASQVMEQLLGLHGSVHEYLYKMAASWELIECNCIEKARKYLLMGIHEHKGSKMLLKEAFKLELLDTDRRRKEYIEKGAPIDPKNLTLTEKKAESIYDGSIKKLQDVDLLDELMSICAEYDFTSNLQNKISDDMCQFEKDERMWDIIARRELNATEEKSTPKERIGKCMVLYETAVQRLNTQRMWSFYLDCMLDLIKDVTVLPNYKRKNLLTALEKGSKAGKLTEKYYLAWINHLQGPKKNKMLLDVLQAAVTKLPESCKLWHTLLRFHLNKGDDKQANQVFDDGIAALTTESLPLWKLMLQFEQIKRNGKIEEIYRKSWTQCDEVSGPLKPMYLEWLVLTQGIAAARKVYDTMCDLPSACLEMHKKMVYLENIQPTMNMKRLRKGYEIACAQFGTHNIDVWMDHCKFEINHGDADKVNEIYKRARTELPPQQFDSFLSEFSLVRTVPNIPV